MLMITWMLMIITWMLMYYGGNNPDISFYMDTMLNVKPNTKSMLIDRLIPSFNDLIKILMNIPMV